MKNFDKLDSLNDLPDQSEQLREDLEESRLIQIRKAAAFDMLKMTGETKVILDYYPTPPINDFI